MERIGKKLGNLNLDFKLIKEYECEACKQQVELIEFPLIGGPEKGKLVQQVKGCKCEERKLASEAIAIQEKHEKEKMINIFKTHSIINDKLKQCKFASYKPQHETQLNAKQKCMNYVKEFKVDESKNLLMSGSYGVGKSHLAISIVRELIKSHSCIFTSVPKLLRKIKSSYDKTTDFTEDQLLTALEQVDVLVLDDLGAEKESDWTTEKIFEVVDARSGKHTITTTNLTSIALADKIGARNFSRLILDTEILVIEGEDMREKTFKKG